MEKEKGHEAKSNVYITNLPLKSRKKGREGVGMPITSLGFH